MENQKKPRAYKYYAELEGGDIVEFSILVSQKLPLHKVKSIYETELKAVITQIAEPKDCKLCKYCGMPTFHKEPEILCRDCREMFGHTFYSEL